MPIRLIAFYLPQFHPFKENNEWWGEGFTEWTNVSKAKPQFLGHYQPHLPGELGFYDLRIPNILKQQIELAQKYGVEGFCFHHYWFSGRRLMELPIDIILADKNLKIPFCLSWANGSFTRCWTGAPDDLLVEQKYSPEDDIAFFDSLVPAFRDERYICIGKKPILVVYNAYKLPEANNTIKRWRNRAKEFGFEGIYIIAAESESVGFDFSKFDFDAVTEFPPHSGLVKNMNKEINIINPDYQGQVFDYDALAEVYENKIGTGRVNFKAVTPSWDNEARRPGRGISFVGSTPERYQKWLSRAFISTFRNEKDERIIFVNAWNEWAEGAHLEPCRNYGYAYLEKTAETMLSFMKMREYEK